MDQLKFDLHTHTAFSLKCGFMKPEQLVIKAKSRDLDGIAITDHNTIKGAIEAKKFETDYFKVIIGCEVTTDAGELIGLFLEHEIESKDPIQVIEEIRDQGGIVIIPHPFDEFRSSRFADIGMVANLVDGIEVFNSRCIKNKSNDIAKQYVIDYKGEVPLSMTGGSDAHFFNEVGNAYTEVRCDMQNGDYQSLLKDAILSHQTVVSGKRSSIMNHIGTKMLKWRRCYVPY